MFSSLVRLALLSLLLVVSTNPNPFDVGKITNDLRKNAAKFTANGGKNPHVDKIRKQFANFTLGGRPPAPIGKGVPKFTPNGGKNPQVDKIANRFSNFTLGGNPFGQIGK